jgi:hypothetical protein
MDAMMNMVTETSWVDLLLQVLITWGRKVVQDSIPAVIPTISGFIGRWLKVKACPTDGDCFVR